MLIYWTLRLAYGNAVFLSRAPAAIERATRLDPWNAGYQAALAARADGGTGDEAWRRATELDPLNSAYWIQRGVRAEFAGDIQTAERFYLQAAHVSRLFSPRIALMNFYFRQGDGEQFWKWAKAAFEIGYGDLGGTFLLCWEVDPDARVILDRALPRDPRILEQFLRFAVERAGVDAAGPVADALLSCAGTANRDALLDYCEGALAAKRFADAREIWVGMGRRGLVTVAAAGAPKNLLYNADFEATPFARGFDWKAISNSEAAVAASGNRGEIDVKFTGNQAEQCEILSQVVALEDAGPQRFSFESRTTSPSDSGLTWRIEDAATGEELAQLPIAQSEDWSPRAIEFQARQTPFVRAVLEYRRRPGTVRYEGRVAIRHMRLNGGN